MVVETGRIDNKRTQHKELRAKDVARSGRSRIITMAKNVRSLLCDNGLGVVWRIPRFILFVIS